MAKSRFEYVKSFERVDSLLPNTYLVVRIDGKGFHKFSDAHGFAKPNDKPALDLMDKAAEHVFNSLGPDVLLAFGESDEYSFLIRRATRLYNRRESKIVTLLVSAFTSAYVFYWTKYFPNKSLLYPPMFDGRVVLYPTEENVRDYFSWRQADTHINNLYNTCYWALIQQSGQTPIEANKTLQGTVSSEKNELLFSRFRINYAKLPAQFRKGSILLRMPSPSGEGRPDTVDASVEGDEGTAERSAFSVDDGGKAMHTASTLQEMDLDTNRSADAETTSDGASSTPTPSAAMPKTQADSRTNVDTGEETNQLSNRERKRRQRKPLNPSKFDGGSGSVVVLHEDLIGDAFWRERPWLLA